MPIAALRPSKSSDGGPPPSPTPEKGWYVYGPNDPKPSWKTMKGRRNAKHMTIEEIDFIKHWKKKEEQELILIHLRTGKYNWDDDDYDD